MQTSPTKPREHKLPTPTFVAPYCSELAARNVTGLDTPLMFWNCCPPLIKANSQSARRFCRKKRAVPLINGYLMDTQTGGEIMGVHCTCGARPPNEIG